MSHGKPTAQKRSCRQSTPNCFTMGKKRRRRPSNNGTGCDSPAEENTSSSLIAHSKCDSASACSLTKKKTTAPLLSTTTTATTIATLPGTSTHTSAVALLPQPFASHWPRPVQGFLRNEPPFEQSFAAALATSYQGFVVDDPLLPLPDNLHPAYHCTEHDLQTTLETDMPAHFRADITQPFGLGTPCAPTYVTRCLVGDPGTTYKYLGIRMFAHHPWPPAIQSLRATLSDRVENVHLPTLFRQRERESREHASCMIKKKDGNNNNLAEKPQRFRGSKNNADDNTTTNTFFDVCLINRMTPNHPRLKKEALDPNFRTTVSWHADSTLEHYSTIAVYQMILPKKSDSTKHNSGTKVAAANVAAAAKDWSVALRVVHHSEGPTSSSFSSRPGQTKMADSVVQETPALAVSLASNTAYYLLDDFNHHHQHTVLTTATANATTNMDKKPNVPVTKISNRRRGPDPSLEGDSSIRYSLTFRLLRGESHNVASILQRGEQTITKQFHQPKSVARIRSQQLLLTELESEWLRQLYIQGAVHQDLLFASPNSSATCTFRWRDAISRLWYYWSRLEERTWETIVWLTQAAQGKCIVSQQTQYASSMTTMHVVAVSKVERKYKDKCRKAAAALHDLMDREKPTTTIGQKESIFVALASLLVDRATMRELWSQRALDPAFRNLSVENRPIPWPCEYNSTTKTTNSDKKEAPSSDANDILQGFSPMPGLPNELRDVADSVRSLDCAFFSGKQEDLPQKLLLLCNPNSFSSKSINNETNSNNNEHCKALDWPGWADFDHFGLEMQYPWSDALLTGRKTIETRSYDLPVALLGKEIAIIETPQGNTGISSLGNIVNLTDSKNIAVDTVAKIVGWCRFSSVIMYTSVLGFERDENAHLVAKSSGFGWNNDTTLIYGWVVDSYGSAKKGMHCQYKCGTRRLRSLFQLTPHGMSFGRKKRPKEKAQNENTWTKAKKRRF